MRRPLGVGARGRVASLGAASLFAFTSAACEPAPTAPPACEVGTRIVRAQGGVEGRRHAGLVALAGDPSARDAARGLGLLSLACDAGSLCACEERAVALETFDGSAAALGEALRLHERACVASTQTRCATSGTSPPRTTFDARILASGAAEEMVACYNWALLLERGAVTAPDGADAAVLKKRACAGGLARACER